MSVRYIEVSRRNPFTKLFVGSGSGCSNLGPVCGDICIEIVRAGKEKCEPEQKYNACCKPEPRPICDRHVAHVCAKEIDKEGYAIFEWPEELYNFKEGWYNAIVKTGCDECGVFPLRIGPRCNVISVETIISGPDNACWVDCEDECYRDPCLTGDEKYDNNETYIPKYEIV